MRRLIPSLAAAVTLLIPISAAASDEFGVDHLRERAEDPHRVGTFSWPKRGTLRWPLTAAFPDCLMLCCQPPGSLNAAAGS